MKRICALTAALALLGLGIAASANVFDLGTGFTNLETVAVGDPGNTGELSGLGAGGWGPDRICGSVGYNYNIGKYEVTTAQYCDFLNNKAKSDPYGLYNGWTMWNSTQGCKIHQTGTSGNYTYSVASDWANRPVNNVSYWSACRFANWLNNGQGNGGTETGTYTLNGYNGKDGRTIGRNAGAKWAVTSEDEWYKAAYYKGGGSNAGYWKYPTQSNTPPSNKVATPDPGNNANFSSQWGGTGSIGFPYYRTIVGEFENSESAYGTFDQGGNVWEWNESIVIEGSDYGYRGLHDGTFYYSVNELRAAGRGWADPRADGSYDGFRVVMVPEPSSIIALLAGLVGLLGLNRRRA